MTLKYQLAYTNVYCDRQERANFLVVTNLVETVTVKCVAGNLRATMPEGLPFRLTGYQESVDWTGRQIRDDMRGAIEVEFPSILDRLEIEEEHWLYMTQNFQSSFKTMVGSLHSLKRACRAMGFKRVPGKGACEALL